MAEFLKSIFSWMPQIVGAFSSFAEWAQGPLISNDRIREIFDQYFWMFDVPNKLLAAVFDVKPLYEMSLLDLVIPSVVFVTLYTLIKWFVGIITGS